MFTVDRTTDIECDDYWYQVSNSSSTDELQKPLVSVIDELNLRLHLLLRTPSSLFHTGQKLVSFALSIVFLEKNAQTSAWHPKNKMVEDHFFLAQFGSNSFNFPAADTGLPGIGNKRLALIHMFPLKRTTGLKINNVLCARPCHWLIIPQAQTF